MQMLESPLEQHDTAAPKIDELIPRPPSARRRFGIAVVIVGLSGLLGWGWGFGWLTPRPHGLNQSATYGGTKIVEDLDSNRVIIASVFVPNQSQFDLVVTEVSIEGLPITIDEVRWTPNGSLGGPARPFFVAGDRPLPAEVAPERQGEIADSPDGVIEEAMESIEGSETALDIYVIPDCAATWPDDDAYAGRLRLRYEFPERAAWWGTWFDFDQPLWSQDSSAERGLIGETALNAADEFIEIGNLRTTMCDFAGSQQ